MIPTEGVMGKPVAFFRARKELRHARSYARSRNLRNKTGM
jgi:hypothetical protein